MSEKPKHPKKRPPMAVVKNAAEYETFQKNLDREARDEWKEMLRLSKEYSDNYGSYVTAHTGFRAITEEKAAQMVCKVLKDISDTFGNETRIPRDYNELRDVKRFVERITDDHLAVVLESGGRNIPRTFWVAIRYDFMRRLREDAGLGD